MAHASLDGALRRFQLQHHAAGNDARLHQAVDLLAIDHRQDFFSVQDTRNIGQIDQLVGTKKFRDRGSHVIGVDVVKFVVRAHA